MSRPSRIRTLILLAGLTPLVSPAAMAQADNYPSKPLSIVVAQLKKALAESLHAPDLRKKLEDFGSTVAPLNVELPKFLADETAKHQRIVDFAKIKE
jgi:hypothetical protein